MDNLEKWIKDSERDLHLAYHMGQFWATATVRMGWEYVGHGPTLEMALIDLDAALEDWGAGVQDE